MSLSNSELKGYTGRLLEGEFLPPVSQTSATYMPYREALRYAMDRQPRGWRPTDPPSRLANDFQYLISDGLGTDPSRVELYTAVGSPLDRYHGVDGWVVYGSKRVTFDVTLNPHKDSYKADVIVRPTQLEIAAAEVADLLR